MSWIATACFVAWLGSPVVAQVTQLVSVTSSNAQGNDASWFPAISADHRFVAFGSLADNLVAGDTNGVSDVFVRDRFTGTTERVSVSTGGGEADGFSSLPSISADGRYVAFHSSATNLVAGDTNGAFDVFVRDRQAGTTIRVSVSSAGLQGDGNSDYPAISADGRYVAFRSLATNLVAGDTNGTYDVFVRDLQTSTTERVSVSTSGAGGNLASYFPTISGDGRYVAFRSDAPNLVAGDMNVAADAFVRDRQLGTTELVSVSSAGAQANSYSYDPSISANGRYVAFWSNASNLVSGDTNGHADIFLRDRLNNTTELVSISSTGAQGNADPWYPSSVSDDGRYVVFASTATNLVPPDLNSSFDVFLRDRVNGMTQYVSVASNGTQGNDFSGGTTGVCPITPDGRVVAFYSLSNNLVPGDTNGTIDVFVRDLNGAGFTSLCDPGVGGVIPCPCSNAPGGPGRGCDNSSATGGAILSASGIAYLSMDSLVFNTSGEKPTATSIVLQGNAFAASGAVFGQGVRCAAGSLKRLYTKSASGGSITAPDIGLGDPTVHVRSAALGDLIQAGESRWYLVYYRDPTVLGGCPSSSTFNATQTGRIDWSL
jgi:Tol biopolymer transport system component